MHVAVERNATGQADLATMGVATEHDIKAGVSRVAIEFWGVTEQQ
jgi:hypothetical protein